MATCPICGQSYDEHAYQVVVVGLGSFDSIACADTALRRDARDRGELVPALVDMIFASRTKDPTDEVEVEPIPTDRRDQPDR